MDNTIPLLVCAFLVACGGGEPKEDGEKRVRLAPGDLSTEQLDAMEERERVPAPEDPADAAQPPPSQEPAPAEPERDEPAGDAPGPVVASGD
jgi:hypothetical protein